MKPHHTLRIAGASGFWGDSAIATPQLLHVPDLDFLVYDYLAETTMSIMARARARDPSAGYATDFVTDVIAPHLQTIKDHSVQWSPAFEQQPPNYTRLPAVSNSNLLPHRE